MIRKSGLLVLGFLIVGTALNAQGCELYDGYKEGSSTKMVHYDAKDKTTGFTVTSIKERKAIADGVSLLFNQLYDNNDGYTYENEFRMDCVGGDVVVDLSKVIDPNTMTAYEDMTVDIIADELSIPKNAKAGDQLDDGSVTITIDTGTPVKVTLVVTLSNRRVEAKEKVNTPAGDFECLKISYDMLTSIGFVKIKTATTEYHHKKHGVVKTETFNKKGKLTGYSVVEEINQ